MEGTKKTHKKKKKKTKSYPLKSKRLVTRLPGRGHVVGKKKKSDERKYPSVDAIGHVQKAWRVRPLKMKGRRTRASTSILHKKKRSYSRHLGKEKKRTESRRVKPLPQSSCKKSTLARKEPKPNLKTRTERKERKKYGSPPYLSKKSEGSEQLRRKSGKKNRALPGQTITYPHPTTQDSPA